jgi:hypothetical protein
MANPRPKPPKKRKSLSRHKGGRDRKQSQYAFDAAREELQLPAANAQQIANPNPTPKSPTKREYKDMLLQEKSKNEALFAEMEETKLAAEAKHRKILSLKDENKRLSDALRQEKEKSRLTILKLMNEAEDVMAEANEIKSIADEKMSAAELIVCGCSSSEKRNC